MAQTQTRGRGRFGREWCSAPGGLYSSYLLYPDPTIETRKLALITLVFGLACAQGIEAKAGVKTEIAWPNDLLIADRKLAGILCETKGRALIVGCGLNVGQTEFPTTIPDAISLRLQTGRDFDPHQLLHGILTSFRRLYDRLVHNEQAAILDETRARMTMLTHRVSAETGGSGWPGLGRRWLEGIALDIDELGRLKVRTDDGQMVVLNAGKVRRIR